MGQVDEPVPGKVRGLILVAFVLQDLKCPFDKADLFAGEAELPQGDVGA